MSVNKHIENRRYPGIQPFTTEQKDLFFGRDNDIAKLSQLILLEKQVLLYSKSGLGKTSLLNAGIVPNLQNNHHFTAINIRFTAYSENNPTPVQTTLRRIEELAEKENTNNITDLVFNNTQTLWTSLKKLQITELKHQLADILNSEIPYSFRKTIAEKRKDTPELQRSHITLFNKELPVKIVFAIRSDRLSLLNNLTDRIPDIQQNFYNLLPLINKQAELAITAPAQYEGDYISPKFTFSNTALGKIMNYLTAENSQNIETTQLQIICQRIEQNLSSTAGHDSISINETNIPNFKNIFFDFYNDAIDNVSNDQKSNARILIEDQLICNQQRISLDGRICSEFIPETELQKLVNSRLIRAERNTVGSFSYELSHDTLVEPIHEAAEERRERSKKCKKK